VLLGPARCLCQPDGVVPKVLGILSGGLDHVRIGDQSLQPS
jgi:hypothetical protein